jgi:hypothetical protein
MPVVHPSTWAYIALALAVVARLPTWGRSLLALLRELDDYRSNRPHR